MSTTVREAPLRRRAIALTALAVAAVFASNAFAEEQRRVRRQGLDLSVAREARLLFRRIDAAALEICGGGRGSLEVVNRATRRGKCWYDATSAAVMRLGSPQVTAAWRAAAGQRARSGS